MGSLSAPVRRFGRGLRRSLLPGQAPGDDGSPGGPDRAGRHRNAGPIDAALAGHPSNKFLKLIATATKAGIETRAAAEKLSQEIEPPALAKDINQATASRNDLEALRRELKTAEANATSFLPRYLALVKAERDRLEAYARSLNLEKDVLSRFMDRIDTRQADIAAVTSDLMSARAEYYRAYDKCAAVLVADFGIYKVTNGQFVFPLQYMANRYNAAAGAKAAAAKRIAELEEKQRTLMQPSPKAWAQFVSGSDAFRGNSSRFAVDDDEVGICIFLTDRPRGLIFGAPVAGEGGLAVGELNHDVSLACLPFHDLELPATYDKAGAEPFECRSRGGEIVGITRVVADGDADDPVGFCHLSLHIEVDVRRLRR